MRLELGSKNPEFLHFLMLSSSHYPGSGWTHSKVRAVKRWPTFSFCQRPSFSYPLAALTPVSLVVLELQGFEGNCCIPQTKKRKKNLSNRSKKRKIQDLLFLFQCFQPPTVLFAELSLGWCLPAKHTDKVTLQGSCFAEIADQTKTFSAAVRNMTILFSVLGEEWARCLSQLLFGTLDWSGLLSAMHLVFHAMHLGHQPSGRATNTDAKRRFISVCFFSDFFYFSEHNYTAARQIYSLLLGGVASKWMSVILPSQCNNEPVRSQVQQRCAASNGLHCSVTRKILVTLQTLIWSFTSGGFRFHYETCIGFLNVYAISCDFFLFHL